MRKHQKILTELSNSSLKCSSESKSENKRSFSKFGTSYVFKPLPKLITTHSIENI